MTYAGLLLIYHTNLQRQGAINSTTHVINLDYSERCTRGRERGGPPDHPANAQFRVGVLSQKCRPRDAPRECRAFEETILRQTPRSHRTRPSSRTRRRPPQLRHEGLLRGLRGVMPRPRRPPAHPSGQALLGCHLDLVPVVPCIHRVGLDRSACEDGLKESDLGAGLSGRGAYDSRGYASASPARPARCPSTPATGGMSRNSAVRR
jgi:hypothetical protein